MPFTKGFNSANVLALKFKKHGALLGAKDQTEYLAMADTFLGGPLVAGVSQCTRAFDNNLLRFSEGAQIFGALFPDNFIATFYRFDPPARDAAWFARQCARLK